MNRDFTRLRISYPMELRHMDISLAITLMSLQRYGYGLSTSDASLRRETVPALVANATDHSLGVVEAHGDARRLLQRFAADEFLVRHERAAGATATSGCRSNR